MRVKPTEREKNNRVARINELLQKEIGDIILRQEDIGPDVFCTVTAVETFPNLQQARVYISIMPEDKKKEVVALLSREIYSIQQMLNRRLKMRPVPKIRWVPDTKTSKTQRVEEILDTIKEK